MLTVTPETRLIDEEIGGQSPHLLVMLMSCLQQEDDKPAEKAHAAQNSVLDFDKQQYLRHHQN
jgi:hypothetical protein